MTKFDDFLIEQTFPSGDWEIRYRLPDGELVKMTYSGMNRAESVAAFERLLKEFRK